MLLFNLKPTYGNELQGGGMLLKIQSIQAGYKTCKSIGFIIWVLPLSVNGKCSFFIKAAMTKCDAVHMSSYLQEISRSVEFLLQFLNFDSFP